MLNIVCFVLPLLLLISGNAALGDDGRIDVSKVDGHGGVDCARVPPSLWCSCDKLAKECGFDELCGKYKTASHNKPIQLTLLYEGLCPGCMSLIVDELYRNVYTKFQGFVDIELVPYGNARLINKYESCAIHFMPEPFPFIYCLESLLRNELGLEKAAKKCYVKFHTVPHIYDQIQHCTNGDLGQTLQLQAAERTMSVWPDEHEFVPWLLFNNVSIKSQQSLQRQLPSAICQWYVGDKRPQACDSPMFGNTKLHAAMQPFSACLAN